MDQELQDIDVLIFLSAGETEAERDKIFLGRGDSPFTEQGKRQIMDAAETLYPYDIDQAYTSDLYRAQTTLQWVLKKNPHETPWEAVEELRERSGGSYEGRKYTDIRVGMSPKQYKAWERDPFEAPEHGESLADIDERLRGWFDTLKPMMDENKIILIVSHPDTLKVLIAMARGDELDEAVGMNVEHGMPYFYYGGSR